MMSQSTYCYCKVHCLTKYCWKFFGWEYWGDGKYLRSNNVSKLISVLSLGLSCGDWCSGWCGPRDVAQAVSLAAAGQPSLGYLTMPTIDNYKTTGQDTWMWWPAWQHPHLYLTPLHAMTSLASLCCTRCYNPLMNIASCFISFNTSIYFTFILKNSYLIINCI